MISRRNGLLKLGTAAGSWLACCAVVTAAAAGTLRDAGDARPPFPEPSGPDLPKGGRDACPLCIRGLECGQHLA